jgi:hypothetical protein
MRRFILILLLALQMTGCYSTTAFRGDGEIQESPEPQTQPLLLYRIKFPEIDVSHKGAHEFRFRGAPARVPMVVLLATPTQRSGFRAKAVVTRIEEENGSVVEERGTREGWSLANGKPGPVWSEFISSTTDYDVPTARMRRMEPGRWYRVRISVLKDASDGAPVVVPAVDFLREPYGLLSRFR